MASAPKLFASSSFAGLTSIAKTKLAPAARATGIAIKPIEPTPVIATLRTLTPAAITVCTALPRGSKIAATSSGIDGSSRQTLYSGIAMYSAKAPSRSTPMILTRSQMCAFPVRQSRHVEIGDVALRRDALAGAHRMNGVADRGDGAHELVPDHDRRLDAVLRP